MRPLPQRLPGWRRWFSCGLVLLVLGLGALTVAPWAHHCLHGDAADTEHACAIALFAHGVLSAAGLSLALIAPVLHSPTPAIDTGVRAAPPFHLLPAGRAPPAL